MRRIRLIALSTLLVVAGALPAIADSSVTYENRSGRTLYIYYATAQNGVTIDCSSMSAGGAIAPGSSWSISVPGGKWGWVKFQENTETAGCGLSNNKFESKITGYADSRSETVNIN